LLFYFSSWRLSFILVKQPSGPISKLPVRFGPRPWQSSSQALQQTRRATHWQQQCVAHTRKWTWLQNLQRFTSIHKLWKFWVLHFQRTSFFWGWTSLEFLWDYSDLDWQVSSNLAGGEAI
jgi:hypothetical protein